MLSLIGIHGFFRREIRVGNCLEDYGFGVDRSGLYVRIPRQGDDNDTNGDQ